MPPGLAWPVMLAEKQAASQSDLDLLVRDHDSAEVHNADSHSRRGDRLSKCIRRARQIVHILRHFLMLLANVMAWYATNGMNGIAMQKAAVALQHDNLSFIPVLANTAMISAVQLLLGALFGRSLLHFYSLVFQKRAGSLPYDFMHIKPTQALLATLHCVGSMSTNLGFMFGSASLVQIIKLMEPFQTLILSKIFSEEGKEVTPGIVMSMTVTVGAAVSLIKSRPQAPPALAVAFALLSGFTMSSRNVLQRQQYISDKNGAPNNDYSPLERALEQFTLISLQSGLLVGTILLPLFLLVTPGHEILFTKDGALQTYVDVFVWHPLYNAFSMVTLGFCSALTHSLLNAGKRVTAIGMAMIWFKEDFTTRNILGLALTLVGGCWYTCESRSKSKSLGRGWIKFGPAMFVLYFLFWAQWEGMLSSSI